MTINQILASPDLRQPVYLVEFQWGTLFFRYTTADANWILDAQEYQVRPLSIGKLSASTSEAVGDATITLPGDDPVIKIFDAFLPVDPVMCTIKYMEANDPDHEVRTIKSGQVTTVIDKDDGFSELKVKPLYEAFNRAVPWQTQQVGCVLMLFGFQCGVNSEDFKTTAVGVIEITTEYVQAAEFDNADPTWFKAGYIRNRRTREIRFILAQEASGVLRISYPFDGAKTTDIFDAFAGCMKLGSICKDKFNNKINFMGFEKIPTKNIFKTGIK